MTAREDDLPPAILDSAIEWAVRLRSGHASEADRVACDAWRARHPEHEHAWQRLQAIEDEFASLTGKTGTRARHALERVRGDRRRRRIVTGLLGLGTVALLAALLAPVEAWQRLQADHVTAIGEQRRITLADGTALRLDTGTAINVERTGGHREIRLHAGAVFVETASGSSAPPLRIRTGQGRFTPVGTRFSVREAGDATRLHVSAGAVRIAPLGSGVPPVLASAGETRRIERVGVETVPPDGIDPVAWTEGVLVARGARLADVLDELARYRRGWLRYDPAVADLPVSGVFRLKDTDAALRALAGSRPIVIERLTDYWVTVAQPEH